VFWKSYILVWMTHLFQFLSHFFEVEIGTKTTSKHFRYLLNKMIFKSGFVDNSMKFCFRYLGAFWGIIFSWAYQSFFSVYHIVTLFANFKKMITIFQISLTSLYRQSFWYCPLLFCGNKIDVSNVFCVIFSKRIIVTSFANFKKMITIF